LGDSLPTTQSGNSTGQWLTPRRIDATRWLAVIGKALAYLCLAKEVEQKPEKYERNLRAKVKFLQGLVSVRRVLESSESVVIQEWWTFSRGGTDVDEQESRAL